MGMFRTSAALKLRGGGRGGLGVSVSLLQERFPLLHPLLQSSAVSFRSPLLRPPRRIGSARLLSSSSFRLQQQLGEGHKEGEGTSAEKGKAATEADQGRAAPKGNQQEDEYQNIDPGVGPPTWPIVRPKAFEIERDFSKSLFSFGSAEVFRPGAQAVGGQTEENVKALWAQLPPRPPVLKDPIGYGKWLMIRNRIAWEAYKGTTHYHMMQWRIAVIGVCLLIVSWPLHWMTKAYKKDVFERQARIKWNEEFDPYNDPAYKDWRPGMNVANRHFDKIGHIYAKWGEW
uniref:Uncharacterized protein n=1 Tax=Chromera velia CCMP2878 TaxID=1169474 RepID=A0A0G4G7B0_9ALVE|mmetsp:Transcript_27169/g.53383  ORF Transcript_27169/g.53383 Transcript_27169/m.53383 type:complete len:286 (-) Transcript_27169:81-938(-)|eukprot:Cvel_20487.t1-p1 / transcript=Cvel_20487.t1 / gene=Cvel_20487 / organism=Chromera_velia_CCMP2878 / gene_product=hypothetical protein / transcript_product=hypothetical protein / location=Cvel_scaffold1842:15511-18657(+) / protein_length=285 / sequence_SO=supercontig / SO=protein_coding / is_pseudo=false